MYSKYFDIGQKKKINSNYLWEKNLEEGEGRLTFQLISSYIFLNMRDVRLWAILVFFFIQKYI